MKRSLIVLFAIAVIAAAASSSGNPSCYSLHPFQLQCDDSEDEAIGRRTCPNPNRTTFVNCKVIDDEVECTGPRSFSVQRPCIWTNGFSFEIAMGLSAVTGVLGFDRCYLGYPTLGFVKFVTGGGFMIWTLLDIILIATQTLGPADGSDYTFSSDIPRLTRVQIDSHSAHL